MDNKKEEILKSEETKKFENLQKQMGTSNQNNFLGHNQICPNCGYCPCCGRPYRNYNYPYWGDYNKFYSGGTSNPNSGGIGYNA